ncbi:serine/threonine-protein phosphatase 7 [Hordeum vulgare]|nr:serine/threonine-protein phosphatase 7 [Hordeum vulgare]
MDGEEEEEEEPPMLTTIGLSPVLVAMPVLEEEDADINGTNPRMGGGTPTNRSLSSTVKPVDELFCNEIMPYMLRSLQRCSMQQAKLMPLKIRSHGASTVMSYGERYTPYIEMTRLLPFIQLVSRSTTNLNAAAINALIDRWRPETHSFYLRTREMTVTLQDVFMITALPVEGKPLCMSTDSEGWQHQMDALIGMSPPEPEVEDGGKKDRVPAGASFTWMMNSEVSCLWCCDESLPSTLLPRHV